MFNYSERRFNKVFWS